MSTHLADSTWITKKNAFIAHALANNWIKMLNIHNPEPGRKQPGQTLRG